MSSDLPELYFAGYTNFSIISQRCACGEIHVFGCLPQLDDVYIDYRQRKALVADTCKSCKSPILLSLDLTDNPDCPLASNNEVESLTLSKLCQHVMGSMPENSQEAMRGVIQKIEETTAAVSAVRYLKDIQLGRTAASENSNDSPGQSSEH